MTRGGRFQPFERNLRKQGLRFPAGIDEVGRGPLAGPVVAAAVILPPRHGVRGLNDSKLLSPRRRELLDLAIRRAAVAVGVAEVSERVIDDINIWQATCRAMKLAVEQLATFPDYLFIDGRPVHGLPVPHLAIVGGDGLCASIAAASIVAKVHRDRLMDDWHLLYPEYDFAANKGYGTPRHLQAIASHGPCPIHRLSFGGVREHR